MSHCPFIGLALLKPPLKNCPVFPGQSDHFCLIQRTISESASQLVLIIIEDSAFAMFIIIEIASFVPHFLIKMNVRTVLTIPFVPQHCAIILISVWVFHCAFNKLPVLEPSLILCPIRSL